MLEIVRIGRRWINLGRMNCAERKADGSIRLEIGEAYESFLGDEADELATLLDMASLNVTWSTSETVPSVAADRPVEAPV